MLRNDKAFILAIATRLVARDLLGQHSRAEERRVKAYAKQWSLDPINLAAAAFCEACLLKERVTKGEEITRGE